MNLQQLRYVLEVEKSSSITRAAKNLFMGQPNLSKAIKELEIEIGVTIFKRTPKGVEPTRDGIQFLQYARGIVSQMDELENLYKTHHEENFKLTLSVPRATYISTTFSEFINACLKEKNLESLPLNIHYKETNAHTVIQDVALGESDLGIVRYQKAHENYFLSLIKEHALHYECIGEFTMCIIMHKSHPLAECKAIPFHALEQYIEILHGDFQDPHITFNTIKKEPDITMPPKRIYIYDRSSQFDLLEQVKGSYLWVSPMPEEILKKHHLVTRKCSFASPTTDMMIYSHKDMLKSHERAFINILRTTLNELNQK